MLFHLKFTVSTYTITTDDEIISANQNTDSSKANEPFTHMRDHAAKMQLNSINTMLHIKSELNSGKRKHQNNDNNIFSSPHKHFYTDTIIDMNTERDNSTNISSHSTETTDYDRYEYIDDYSKKSSRACKGKRYQEFMTTGKLQQTPKKIKVKASTYMPQNGLSSIKKLEISPIKSDDSVLHDREKIKSALSPNDSDGAAKLYDASDFHLEEKIKQLPSLNLEIFLAKKRETKKKKRVSGEFLFIFIFDFGILFFFK